MSHASDAQRLWDILRDGAQLEEARRIVASIPLEPGLPQVCHALLATREARYADAVGLLADFYRRFPGDNSGYEFFIDCCAQSGAVDVCLDALPLLTRYLEPLQRSQLAANVGYSFNLDGLTLAIYEGVGFDAAAPEHRGQVRALAIFNAMSVMRRFGITAGIDQYRNALDQLQQSGVGSESNIRYWAGQTAPPLHLHLHSVGVGDYFHFSRYVAPLAAGGCQNVDIGAMIGTGLLPVIDDDAATMVLPHTFAEPSPHAEMVTDGFYLFTTFFQTQGYLPPSRPMLKYAASERADAIIAQLRRKAKGKPCRMIFWSCCESAGRFAVKSLTLADVEPLLARDDTHWVVAQRGVERDYWLAHELAADATTLPDTLSYAEVAQIMVALDGVVSNDTGLLHLAGSLMVPTIAMLSIAHCFRWERHEGFSPWYPTVRLIRQPRLGDWAGVVRQVGDLLSA